MSNCTLIIGESGTGKSSSIRNLDCNSTFIINVLDKPMPFKGYKSKYNSGEMKNMFSTDDHSKIIDYIKAVNERRADVKVLIIDDFQYVLANEFMRRSSERGFDKFTEIARHAWDIVKALTECREDLLCFVISHSDQDNSGKIKCKTIGKMLDDKITIEGMFTTVLHSMIVDGEFKFLTQNNGVNIAKSPVDMFSEKYIDNDLKDICIKINDYYN